MTTTVFVFHPNLETGSKANHALARTAQSADLTVRDMYALYPDFQIDVKAEQAILEKTDRIVLQFPMYWYSMPALMKEWLDRVLEYGWAYGSTGKALQGKEVILALTQGAQAGDYQSEGRFHVTTQELLKPLETIKYHTGLVFLEPFVLSGAMTASDDVLSQDAKDYLAAIKQ